LTAGSGAASSIPACESAAPVDPSGEGALQLTGGSHQQAIVVSTIPLSTASGLRIVYTDYSFDGSAPGGEGTVMFLTDASQPVPAAAGPGGSALGYAGQTVSGVSKPGLANAYVGVGLDEHGNYSNPAQGYRGGPGAVPETIAVRGAAASGWQYIGGYTSGAGTAASLPFSLDQPVAWRSSAAPTVRIDLTPGGTLSAAIDTHDGSGFVPYYAQSIVGIGGQPAVPAAVHIGFSAGTGAAYGRHQIGNLTVTSLMSGDSAAFAPTSVPNLSAWYDASNARSLSLFGSSVAAWSDLSGNGNTLAQANSGHEPSLVSSGIDGKPSVAFAGSQFLTSSNGAFSSNLFNQSTVFAVTNQSSQVQHSSVLYSGVYDTDPHWGLILSEGGAARFDLDNKSSGRLSANDVAVGPALWTAAGSIGAQVQYLRKNGNLLASDKGPATPISGAYSLAVGAMAQGSSAGSFYNGQLGEVVVYNRYLSTAESEEVEGYLACKWGLQARLPANHPYRSACPQGGSSPSLPVPSPSPPGIGNPPQLRSANGLLTFNVTAQANPSTGNPTLLYNGSSTLPTLRLLPGDTLVVNLTNTLTTPPANAGYTNDVNLHYHGLHVSPREPGDDSIDMVAAPGASLHYQIAIPKSHPPGLYWYHPHLHGEVDRDVLAGMTGAIIIDGIVQYAPQVANMPERVLIARAAPLPGHALPAANPRQLLAMRWAMQHGVGMHGGTSGILGLAAHGAVTAYLRGSTNAATRNPYVTVDPHYRSFNRADIGSNATSDGQCNASSPQAPSYAFTLNRATQPSIAIRPGEQQFWRLVNADADTYLNLSIDHTQMQIVAIDGVPLSNGVNTPASLKVTNWLVPPGGRVEFIVTGPPVGASLRSLCFDSGPSGLPMPAMVLATLNASASPTDLLKLRQVQRRASESQRYQSLAHSAASIRAHAVANTRTVYYSDQYTINGTAYDPSGPPMFYVQSGTTEEWTIVNTSTQVHTFHIHQIHFLVEAINGATQSQQYLMDDVNVPAATSAGPGSVKLLLDFTDPTVVGTFLFHCHILSHEDGGMMAKVQVGGLPPLALSASQVNFKSPTAASQSVSVSGGEEPYSVSGCAGVARASVSGGTVTLSPTAGGSCLLTIADASTPTLTGSVLVNVTAAPAAIKVSPTSVAFVSRYSNAQNVTISGGTAPYSASGCQGVATTSVGGQTLTVTPAGVGTCTLAIVDAARDSAKLSVSVNASSTGSALDNLTFHQNAARLGWYQNEVALNTTTVASSSFGLLGKLAAPSGMPAFGKVYAQPLFVTNQTVSDGSVHNLIIIATETDQIYAFDETTQAVVWHRDFTGANVTPQSFEDSGCSDVNPVIGITGTPVIDRAQNKLYVVVATKENGNGVLRLHAVSLASGADAVAPVPISGSVALATGGIAQIDPTFNFNRGALLEANGAVYVALGTHCDDHATTTHGWILAYNPSTLQQVNSIVDTTNAEPDTVGHFLGSPWMGGYGPSADAQGNIYIATGNGAFDGVNNFGDSVLKLPGNLNVSGADFFAPATAATDGLSDLDLGSGGAMVLPNLPGPIPHLLVQAGKCDSNNNCYKRLLNRDALGGQQPGDAGVAAKLNVGGGVWGGPAYFADASGTSHIVYGGGSPLSTLNVNTSPVSLSVQSSASVGCLECRDHGAQPVVSSNGTEPGTAVVWALKTPGQMGGQISLYAFDALNMSHTLFAGTAGNWTMTETALWVGGALVSPLVVDGRVYVPTDGTVAVFGLR
jgi:FtsP/CotA-like multicopper oxidase with cupredoxin domain